MLAATLLAWCHLAELCQRDNIQLHVVVQKGVSGYQTLAWVSYAPCKTPESECSSGLSSQYNGIFGNLYCNVQ